MPASLPFSKSFDFASGATGERFQNPFWKFKEYLFGGPFRRAVSEVKRFGNEIVAAAVRKREKSISDVTGNQHEIDSPLQNNLINSLLDHIEDRQVVADAAMNYLSAGIIHLALKALNLLIVHFNSQRYDSPVLNLGHVYPDAASIHPSQHPQRTENHIHPHK